MIYPQVDWQKWAEMYKIKTDSVPCSKCGTKSHTTRVVPVSKEKLEIFGLLTELLD